MDGDSDIDMVTRSGDQITWLENLGSLDTINSGQVPDRVRLLINFPNPFNPSTTIKYELSEQSSVTLKIYDIQGQHIQTLVSGIKESGEHEIQWNGLESNGNHVSSGVYLAKLQSSEHSNVIKMVYLR